MTMKFEEALAELKRVAGVRYCMIEYSLTFPRTKGDEESKPNVKCWVYVDRDNSGTGHTWAEALAQLRGRLAGLPDHPETDMAEAPAEG